MHNYSTDPKDKFSSTLIRKLIDCQEVDEYLKYLDETWRDIADAVRACPPIAYERTQAFENAILDIADKSEIHGIVFSADLDAKLEELKPKRENVGGLLSADEILTTEWPEPVWAIPKILPVGLGILAGPPKMGKSWLALQTAQAVSAGGMVLGERVEQGPVLYLALEDPPRRLQQRMKMQGWSIGLNTDFLTVGHFFETIGDLRKGGVDQLTALIVNGGYRLVVIDTFSRAISGDQNDVAEMTKRLAPLQELSHEKNCALILVDHHRKSGGKSEIFDLDAVRDVLGSTAKGAMADTVLGLYRERGKSVAKLAVTGREIEEKTLALRFDVQTGCWQNEGDAYELEMTERRQEIIDALQLIGRSQLKAIYEAVGQPKSNTHNRLQDLVNAKMIKRTEDDGKVFYELR